MLGKVRQAVDRPWRWIQQHPLVLALGFLMVLICWLFSATLSGGKVLGPEDLQLFQSPFAPAQTPSGWHPSNNFLFDVLYVFHPDMQYARAALRSLTLPTWDPYIGAGEPLLATQQHAIFFPANWLTIVAPFWSSLAWVAAIKVFAAGAGMLLFLRALSLRVQAALLGAVSYAFNTFLLDWLEHDLSNAFVVLPWLFLAATMLARTRRPRNALLLGAAFGADWLGGHPETAFITTSAAALWFVALLFGSTTVGRLSLRERAHALMLFAGSLTLGFGLAAVVYVPFLELLGQARNLTRSAGGGPGNYLFTFVAPELWGRPDKWNEIAGAPTNYLERAAYFGVIPLIFGIAGLAARRSRAQLFFSGAAALAMGLVVEVPLYTHIGTLIPVLDRINRFRYLGVVAFCGAVLAGYGLQVLLTERLRSRRVAMTLAAVVVLVVPLLWVVSHPDVLTSFRAAIEQLPNAQHGELPRRTLQLASFLRWAVFGVVGVALLAVGAYRPRLAAALAVLAIGVTGYDLVSYNKGFHPAIPAEYATPPEPAQLTEIGKEVGSGRIAGGVEFLPNLAERYQLRDARVYELPEIERRTRLWEALGGAAGGDEVFASPPEDGTLASLFSVRYMLSYTILEHPSSQWVPRGAQPLVENREALPRAWVAYDWRASSGIDESLAAIAKSSASVDMQRPVIENVPAQDAPRTAQAEPVAFVRDTAKYVSFEVNLPRPGYLVLNDTYFPGWSATVDGHATTIHPANVAFRAVAVPAGRHFVAFDYAPASVKIGVLLTLLSLVVLLVGLVLAARNDRLARRGIR